MADRGATWCDVEVKALLEVWLGELIQAHLSGAYRNETVFQMILIPSTGCISGHKYSL